ncbi:uncharacterized protein CANTADRAFT_266448 [Suhomyces tanzawaensis NRRL Y-17324]|uniref:Nucleolar protein Dnt1-like N-terminal domain-containing protein n=1 Tax=Suhomyces tanzawaensis NRRL Y-17324 TaxID=984487 RepID=A0A1E4SG11_9ASCO|nr:uncharacterized protein CANTADRAFT_266448 [Suhomyces tanzawaensis NRRL Y-17324]ODV78453.1 hypothetical protein CANTADRAFT_266448 [Suhomyces tanzawaensis NRRL Y-17324]
MGKFKIQALLIPEIYLTSSEESGRSTFGSTKRFLHLANPKDELHTVMEAISARFKKLYPTEDELQIVKLQDSRFCDLDPDYVLEDVLESEDVLRVIVNNTFHRVLPTATPLGNKSSDLAQSTPLLPSAPSLIDDTTLPNSRKRTQAYFDQIDPHIPSKSSRNASNFHLEAPKLSVKKTRKKSSPVYDADDSNISLPPPEIESNLTIPVKPFVPNTTESSNGKRNGRITSGMLTMPIHTQLEHDDILQSPNKEYSGSPSSSMNSFTSLDELPEQYTVNPKQSGDQLSGSSLGSSPEPQQTQKPTKPQKSNHKSNVSAQDDTLSKQEILDIFKKEIVKPQAEIKGAIHKSATKYNKVPKKLIKSLEIDMVEGNTALASISGPRSRTSKRSLSIGSKDATKLDSEDDEEDSESVSDDDEDYVIAPKTGSAKAATVLVPKGGSRKSNRSLSTGSKDASKVETEDEVEDSESDSANEGGKEDSVSSSKVGSKKPTENQITSKTIADGSSKSQAPSKTIADGDSKGQTRSKNITEKATQIQDSSKIVGDTTSQLRDLPALLKNNKVANTSQIQTDSSASNKVKLAKADKPKAVPKEKAAPEINIDPELISRSSSPMSGGQSSNTSEAATPSKLRMIHLLNRLRSYESQLSSYKQGNSFTPDLLRRTEEKEEGLLDHTIKLTSGNLKVLKDGKIVQLDKSTLKSNLSSVPNSPSKLFSSSKGSNIINSPSKRFASPSIVPGIQTFDADNLKLQANKERVGLETGALASVNASKVEKVQVENGTSEYKNISSAVAEKLKRFPTNGAGDSPSLPRLPLPPSSVQVLPMIQSSTSNKPNQGSKESTLELQAEPLPPAQALAASVNTNSTKNGKVLPSTNKGAESVHLPQGSISPFSAEGSPTPAKGLSHLVPLKAPSPSRNLNTNSPILPKEVKAVSIDAKGVQSPGFHITSSQVPALKAATLPPTTVPSNTTSPRTSESSQSSIKKLNKVTPPAKANDSPKILPKSTPVTSQKLKTPIVPPKSLSPTAPPKPKQVSPANRLDAKRKFDASSDESESDSSDSSDSDAEVSESKRPRLVTSVPAAKKSQSPLAASTSKPANKKVTPTTPSNLAKLKTQATTETKVKPSLPSKQSPSVVTPPVSKIPAKPFSSSKIKKPILTSLEDLALRGVPEVKESVGKNVPSTSQQSKKFSLPDGSSSDDESESESDSESDSSSDSDDDNEESEKFISIKKVTNQTPKKKGNLFSSLKR